MLFFNRVLVFHHDLVNLLNGHLRLMWPLFPQTPTNPVVVQTSLDYFISLSLQLGQEKTVVTCDQAMYDIIKCLVVKCPERCKDVIVRLGGFHIATNFLGSIGFFMKESGI